MTPARTEWHPTNAGADSKVVFWRLEGGQALFLSVACVLSIGLFRVAVNSWGWPIMASAVVAGLIPISVLGFLLKFVTGRPKSYAADWLEWQWLRLATRLVELGLPLRARPLIGLDRTSSER